MEETVIVIMQKNKGTGFLERELGSYSVSSSENLIYNIFALEDEGKISVHMRLTTERDLADWEFSAVFDYYDAEPLLKECDTVESDDSLYNPMWEVRFDFSESQRGMEDKISTILDIHKTELDSVYEAIKDLEQEYTL